MASNRLQFTANGNISTSRFVHMDNSTPADFKVLQSAVPATDKVVGVSQPGTHDAPGVSGAATTAAAAGQQLDVFTVGEQCLITAGAAVTCGDYLKPDSTGRGITVTFAETGLIYYGGIALEAASGANVLIRMLVLPGVVETSNLSPIAFTFTGLTGANIITYPDDEAAALIFQDASQDINSLTFVSTNGSDAALFGVTVRTDAVNLSTDTTTGTKIGTGTTQKYAFWNATPIVQPANTVDYVTMLTNLGLRATGGTAAATFPGRVVGAILNTTAFTTDTYGAANTIDVTKGYHVIAADHNTSATSTFTPSAAGTAGDELVIVTEANANGTVTVTFASTFHSAGTQATTASTFSSITFISDGTRWLECGRVTAMA